MRMKITKRFMVGMIGIDYDELRRSADKNLDRFHWAAIFVAVILMLSLFSVYYAFELMFHKWYVQFLLSLFFSLMFGIIYVLLLQTISKKPLGQKQGRWFNVPNLLRGGFILFIGFLLSKPVEIFILSMPLDKDIARYRQELNISFEQQTKKIYAADIARLQMRQSIAKNLGNEDDLQQLSVRIRALELQQSRAIQNASARISGSPFFLERVRLAAKHYRSSWVICLVILILFFTPALLVYTVSSNNRYYIGKNEAEEALVMTHYLRFRDLYTKNFLERYNLSGISFYETHTDPPFRNHRTKAPGCDSQKDFFNRFRNYGLPERIL
ncbi:DUF4407 domain-containing protein [Sediminibacterium ginsengisoli]|uniref:DUF4407 domain-containing protein n=1 Tax=Sediminibacterium ginsengisoli TaxID=413434 RepID=A0A1T4M7A3_9BACT|nr:DUF4407 domain-containing protein [Sediminibacterium ginsengisoli]SJZ62737.1 protein of unknown function [Sediminibacterium ginsengisoli]